MPVASLSGVKPCDMPQPRVQGGIQGVFNNNQKKAQVVYDAIAASEGFYRSPVDPAARSLMNVPFTIPAHPDLEKEFVAEAAKEGLVCLPSPRPSPTFAAIALICSRSGCWRCGCCKLPSWVQSGNSVHSSTSNQF